jgi:glycerol kinase
MKRIRPLVLAIDQGTTSTRCITFDKSGKVIHSAFAEFPQIYSQPGWVEHDPEQIFQSLVDCVSILNFDSQHDEIKAIGITNQRETIVAWDRFTGKPFHNAIVWLDTRTHELAKQEISDGGPDKYRNITGLPVSTYFSALKIKWLLDNVPAVAEGVLKNRCCFGTIDSYLTWRLTKGAAFVTDCTNASRYNLMDILNQEWSKEITDMLGIPLDALPRIVSNSEIVGHVDPELIPALANVPITGLIGDQHAALLGHGCTNTHECKITYGTGCFLLMNTGPAPVESKSKALLTTMAYKLGPDAKPAFALEGSVAAAGRAVQWAKDNLRIGHDLIEFNEIASSVPDSCGVTFVPAFSGLLAPYWKPDARAVIVGMSLRASYKHIARSILESTALQCAEVVKLIRADAGLMDQDLSHIVTDGGMTKSALLMQIQSDLLNVIIRRARMSESTAFGAALCAGMHIGFWEGLDPKQLVARQSGYDEFSPEMTEDARHAAFERWDDAVKRSFDLARFAPQDE